MAESAAGEPVWLWQHCAGTSFWSRGTTAGELAAAGGTAGQGGPAWRRTVQPARVGTTGSAGRRGGRTVATTSHPGHVDHRDRNANCQPLQC